MDGSWTGSVDVSINEAFTAHAFGISPADLADNAGPGSQLFGINASSAGHPR